MITPDDIRKEIDYMITEQFKCKRTLHSIGNPKHFNSYVYLAYLPESNRFKLGRSIDPRKRMWGLYEKADLICKIRCTRADLLEAYLNDAFDYCCLGGEYFDFGRDEVRHIRLLSSLTDD